MSLLTQLVTQLRLRPLLRPFGRCSLGALVRLLVLFLCASLSLAAQANGRLESLAKQPLWLDLLHINQGGTWRGVGESYVDDPAFFLASDGAHQPLAELKADVTAFTSPGDTTRCRFPARYKFLAKQLGWQEQAPFAACPDYLKWRAKVPDQQLVLAFPAAYLNSPSSMFGHVFLRLDPKVAPDAVLTSWAVSFAADTNQADGGFAYAFKGIVGSYPGFFSVTSYADKLQEYSHLENRDIWEYRLNLTPAELSRLVDHLWELKKIRFDYYFFDENCAYALLQLVQVARPSVPLLTHMRFAELPVNSVRELEKKGFIDAHHYRPSKEVQLRWEASQLPADQQRLAKRLAADVGVAKQPTFTQMTRQARFNVASLAYNYRRYKHREGARRAAAATSSFQLLRLMHANATGTTAPAVPQPVAPDQGHDSRMWALAAGQRDSAAYMDLTWRYTYHDWLDNSAGFLKGAEINALNLTLRTYVNHADTRPGAGLRLQSLQLVDIRSLAPRDRFVKPISWFVDGGLEQTYSGGRLRLTRYLQGGPGLAWQAGDFIPYVYATARIENNSAWSSFIESGAGSDMGVLYYRGRLSAQLGLSGMYFVNDAWRATAKMGVNWALGRDNAVRLTAQHERYRDARINQWSLGWRHYF